MRLFLTGDTHGKFDRIKRFCESNNTTTDDVLIILGDAGINFYLGTRDVILKEMLSEFPITFLCIHGNHEERPENIGTYKTKEWQGGIVYYEPQYPNILFAKDCELFNLNGQSYFVFGGAYSIDKSYRLAMCPQYYFASELPTENVKMQGLTKLDSLGWKVDNILTHTCPLKYEPVEWFLSGVDQSAVDKTLEYYLDEIEDKTEYKKWYCGHFHGVKKIDKIQFMYEDYIEVL